jgi:cytosol alanyl aminopeptidase
VPNLADDSNGAVVGKTLAITSDLQNTIDPSVFPKYRQYITDVYGPRAHQLGWTDKPGESDDDRLLRPRLVDVIARQAEDPSAQTEARRLALAWFDDHDAVSPDMVGTALRGAAIHGDRNLFERMRAAARTEKDEQIQLAIFEAMGSFRDPEIVKTAMPIVLTDEFDSRHSIYILVALAQEPATRDQVYDYIKQKWDALIAKLPTDWGANFPYLASSYCDEQHRQDVKAYFDGRATKYTGGPRNLAQTLESIDLCIAYKKVQQPSLTEFLQRYSSIKPERATSGAQ